MVSKQKQLRKLGNILLDLEEVILEIVEEHDLQWGDILGLVYSYLMVHCIQAREEYMDGSIPEFYYGPERKD